LAIETCDTYRTQLKYDIRDVCTHCTGEWDQRQQSVHATQVGTTVDRPKIGAAKRSVFNTRKLLKPDVVRCASWCAPNLQAYTPPILAVHLATHPSPFAATSSAVAVDRPGRNPHHWRLGLTGQLLRQ